MPRRFHLPKPKKCRLAGKTIFKTEKDASYAMMRTWAHDSRMNIYDYHTYPCGNHFHFGNKKTYEKYVKPMEVSDTVSTSAS